MMETSLNFGEVVKLIANETYIVIDALYLNEIKEHRSLLVSDSWKDNVRTIAFPYVDNPFAIYKSKREQFVIAQIKEVKFDPELAYDPSVFSSDTGIILFLAEKHLSEFVQNYDYETLTDSLIDLLNLNYWKNLILNYPAGEVAIVFSQGIDTLSDLNGSGIYQIYDNPQNQNH